ncbi:MAG: hypothetical protein Kow0090_07090 [Myxococcota bacterium]
MPGGGKLDVKVRIFRDVKGKMSAKVVFIDTGVGISAENLEKIFQPFFTTKPKGTGLGLAICGHIIRAHKGSIEVQSEVNKGSVFVVNLPLWNKHKNIEIIELT